MKNNQTYIIAEIGSNHDGNLEKALEMVKNAHRAGADAVKFQTFQVDKLLNPLVFEENNAHKENWVYSELKKVEIDEKFHQVIKELCLKLGLDFISAPFDEDSLAITARYCHKLKIASSEITNLPLLSLVGAYNLPVILSTGISTLGEVENAISALIRGGVTDLSLLHCVSLYPLTAQDANLTVIQTLRQSFGLPTGFSDHSLDDTMPLAAVALGARLIEKHVTLKREERIFDHPHSMEFEDFKAMVDKIRVLETALGDGIKKIGAQELEIKKASNKSLFAAGELKPGTPITPSHIKGVRPLIGIPVKHLQDIIGKKVKRPIPPNYPIFWEDIEW